MDNRPADQKTNDILDRNRDERFVGRELVSSKDVVEWLEENAETYAEDGEWHRNLKAAAAEIRRSRSPAETKAEWRPLQPREFEEDGSWLCVLEAPDYVASGETLEQARLNFWKGLALTFWERSQHGLPLGGAIRPGRAVKTSGDPT